MNGTYAIEANNLAKQFKEIKAVNGISFRVEAGEIFSLLGPNGAGKSTTISMLSGLLAPSRGEASIAGHSIRTASGAARAAWGWSRRTLLYMVTFLPARTWFSGAKCTGCAAGSSISAWMRYWT
jgi:ABC-type multidrug transport system ATPase subunit